MFLEICFDVIWAHALQHIVLSQNTHNKDSATYTTQNCCRNTLLQNCAFAFNVRTEIDNHWVQRDSTCHATHTQKNIRSRIFLSTVQCGKCRGHCVYLVPGFLSKRVSLSFITAANCVQPHTHHKDSATCRNTEVLHQHTVAKLCVCVSRAHRNLLSLGNWFQRVTLLTHSTTLAPVLLSTCGVHARTLLSLTLCARGFGVLVCT